MLILGRTPGQSIIIGEGVNRIELKVLNCGSGGVRLGFDADESVKIIRKEVLERQETTLQGPSQAHGS